jgi:biopolymer transport protein ExbD
VQFKPNSLRSTKSLVDMTPLIDIVFQLLIFFLVTAQMAEVTRAQLDLPKEAGEEASDSDKAGLTINVLADGSVVVADETLSEAALDRAIEAAIDAAGGADMLKPLVRADRNCDAERLNEVFRRLSSHGLAAVRLATERGR